MKNCFNCYLNDDDAFLVRNAERVDMNTKNQYFYTLWTRNLDHLNKIPHFFQNESIDLFYVALMVFYADRKVLRAVQPDSWTRSFRIYMPVLCLDKWNTNKKLLEKMLKFLTGDYWEFYFRERQLNDYEEKRRVIMSKQRNSIDADEFCMLSGGMDSYIGAIDLLSLQKRPIFVGNYSGGKGVSVYQNKVISLLSAHFNYPYERFYQFYAAPKKGVENTTRSRSIVFFSHAILLASGMGHPTTLYVPENGVISLNVPLTVHRAGSLSTRTTHPYFMGLLQELLSQLGIDVTIKNPYQFSTKGEMANDCKDKDFLAQTVEWTMSCSHPDLGRYKKHPEPSHCGTCLPCTIRRAALLKAGIEDHSVYRDKDYKEPEAKTYLKSYRLGLRYYATNQMDSLMAIQQSGPIEKEHQRFAALYEHGMSELKDFIETL